MKPTHTELFYTHQNWKTAKLQAESAWQAYYAALDRRIHSQELCAFDRATEAQSRAVRLQSAYQELKVKYHE